MKITENEIDTVQEAGMLDKHPVKFIRTKGGFWIAVGKPKGKSKEEAIAAGSHPAIVKFDLEKRFPGFEATMMKSEHFSDNAVVDKHSHFLSDELRKSGHDIYSVQEGSSVNFHITRHNLELAKVNGSIQEDYLIINGLDIPKEFGRGMAGAAVEKAVSCKVGLRLKK